MADRKMSEFSSVSNAAYIYAEAADGSQVKIKASDLKNLFCYATYIEETVDLNTFNNGGVFHIRAFTNGPGGSGNYIYLENLTSGSTDRIQRVNFILSSNSYRRIKVNDSWTAWMEI